MDSLKDMRDQIDYIDEQIAAFFEQRMHVIEEIAAYKESHNVPICDKTREQNILQARSKLLEDERFIPGFLEIQKKMMEISSEFQMHQNAQSITPPFSSRHIIKRNVLCDVATLLNLERKVLIVTDDGVPQEYSQAIAAQCKEPHIFSIEQGESSKNLGNYGKINASLCELGFMRNDCVVAVGGGVVGDLAGFAASTFMRGIDFYNIPTTLLSQVDSCLGGKTAIDFCGYKNIVGTFWQPSRVIIDFNTLNTLPSRHIANGLAECVKIGLTSDAGLFELFEKNIDQEDPRKAALEVIDVIVERSLSLKAQIVNQDSRDNGLRHILNFGHTIGHGIESCCPELLHGECVSLGMLCMCNDLTRERLRAVLHSLNLLTSVSFDADAVIDAISHDKKCIEGKVSVVYVDKPGTYTLDWEDPKDLKPKLCAICE